MRTPWSFAVLILVGCGGDDAGTMPTPTPTEEVSWQDMDDQQRATYMNDVVLPEMQVAFEAYDARFAGMDCATCHGPGAADGTFAMPNSDLPAIDFYAFPTGPGADFMSNEVVPMMVDLLDAEPFNTTDGSGFGCLGCHPAAM